MIFKYVFGKYMLQCISLILHIIKLVFLGFDFDRQLVKSVTLFVLGVYIAREVAAAEASAPVATS